MVIDGVAEPLLATEVSLRGLDAHVTKQNLDLLKLPSRLRLRGILAGPRSSNLSDPHGSDDSLSVRSSSCFCGLFGNFAMLSSQERDPDVTIGG